ncbi:hypothetical protein CP082626L3_0899A, partial [Chlamydia psittaci 08-2626_L3]
MYQKYEQIPYGFFHK